MLFQKEYSRCDRPVFYRKEKLSPKAGVRKRLSTGLEQLFCERAFFRAPPSAGVYVQPRQPKNRTGRTLARRAALTVEAAVVLPVFLLCMTVLMQYVNVYRNAASLGAALAQTGEEMAIGAYTTEYMEEDSILGIVLSAAYGAGRTYALAGKTDAIVHDNFVLSSFLEKEDLVDLVMTYQVRKPTGLVKIPGSVWIQRGCVRGWTGREGSSGKKDEKEDEHAHQTVYVTEHGSVYHKDENCTHIHLHIMQVSLEEASKLRNVNREKYYPCEFCGHRAQGTVYITSDGNRYHSSLECHGLKRTVHEMDISEVGDLRPCSRCGGA